MYSKLADDTVAEFVMLDEPKNDSFFDLRC